MTTESGATAHGDSLSKAPRRGPRKESEIRAEVEAQLRAELEDKIRAEYEERLAEERRQVELARAANSSDPSPVSGLTISGDPGAQGAVTIHFVEDGFTVLGKVWYRGEELTIVPGTKQWEESPHYAGKIFADLDEFDQEAIWGQRYFRQGPWRGKRLSEIDDPELTEADRAALMKAEQIRNERYGAVTPQR